MKTREKDERLLPMPGGDIRLAAQDIPTNYSPFYDEDLNQARALREYFLIVYKRLPLILALTILITAVVAFYMYRQPPIYEAQTTMIIEPPKPKAQQKDTGININFGYDFNYYNTQLKLLKNPELLRKVVIRLGLQKDPNLFNQSEKGFLSTLLSAVSGKKAAETKENSLPTVNSSTTPENTDVKQVFSAEEQARIDAYSSILAGGISVDQVPATNLVNIKFTGNNPDLAPRVADMVATVFIDDDLNRSMKGAESTYQDLTKSIQELQITVAEQEAQRLAQMKAANLPLTTGSGGKQADFNAERLSTLSGQYLTAEDDRRKIQAEYEAAVAASKRGEIWAAVGKDNEAIQNARNENLKRKTDLEKRLEEFDKKINEANEKKRILLAKYTEEWKEVKQIDSQLKELQSQRTALDKEITQKIANDKTTLEKGAEREVLTRLQTQLASAQRRESELKSAYFAAVGISGQQGQAETQLTTLTSTIETNRSLLNTYISRQKEMELMINSERPNNLTISSPAMKPMGPVGPQRNRNIFIAFFLSLGIGVGLAFLLDYLDDSIKNSEDVGKYLGLATLALIPHQHIGMKKKRGAVAGKTGAISSTALVSIDDTRSAMAEAYRHLRTSLLFSSAGKPPQSILITSSQPSEGKTTTAINTAITLAQSGADVVIIDCDLRRPRLQNHFNLENTSGLTNYLSGEKNIDKLLKPFGDLPKLKIITSGPIPPNPTELLSSNEMKNLMLYLRGNFDHIIIDSPPAISFTDAAIIATLVDGVVMVAMAGKSSIHLIRRFKQRLNTIGVRIFGVVLNGLKPDSFEYGDYGYGYNYTYEIDDDGSTPRMEDVPKSHSANK